MHISYSFRMLRNLNIRQLLSLVLFFSCFLYDFTRTDSSKFFLLISRQIRLLVKRIRSIETTWRNLTKLWTLTFVYVHFSFLIRIGVKLPGLKLWTTFYSFRNNLILVLIFFICFRKIDSDAPTWDATLSFLRFVLFLVDLSLS